MGDHIVFKIVRTGGQTSYERGIVLEGRIFNYTLSLSKDIDTEREYLRDIENAIARGNSHIVLGNGWHIYWQIHSPWNIPEGELPQWQ